MEMKLIERITYVTYWINIIAVVLYFIGLPVSIIIAPEVFNEIAANKGHNTYNYLLTILAFIVFGHWVYCLWFLFKYDRYSKSIFPLIFFNALYAPIYYYRVKIKKRPLRNKIHKPQQGIVNTEESIKEEDFSILTKDSILESLHLWSSVSEQLRLREFYSSKEVSCELFDYWSSYVLTDDEILTEVFSVKGKEFLEEFNNAIASVESKYNNDFPEIEKFIETEDWKSLNALAKKVIEKIERENAVGNN
ncbi:hypothetical protein [Saccharicrinis aurantiacus]|uniref:hypothetical protein n=1 Tax=Saccharicrinis aurantiacus TaxID=1849719 RepID=UPI0008391280|nr:hypothetical protein [Saccharicrinis aurantiacus]